MYFKSNYPKLVPNILHKYIFILYNYVTIPLALISNKLQIFTSSLLSNLTILSLYTSVILYLLSYFGLYINYNLPILVLFYISYIITHLQLSPYEPVMTTTYTVDTNFDKKILFSLFVYVFVLVLYYLYLNSFILYFGIMFGLLITYYNVHTFRKDVENRNMDVYRVELWASVTSGLYYTFVLSIILSTSLYIQILIGLLFAINTLLFYKFRINRFDGLKKYEYKDIYEKIGPTHREIINYINDIQNNKLKNEPNDIFDDKELMSNLMMGNISLDEFKDEITITENIDEEIKDEIREDIKWSWMELYEQLIIYLQNNAENVNEPDFDNYNKQDIIELKSEMISVQDDLNENAPPNLKNSINRFIHKLDNSIDYWEKMNN